MPTALDSLRLLSRAYTRPMFAELARTGDTEPVLKLLLAHGQIEQYMGTLRLAELFNLGWTRLATNYRNEYVYRTSWRPALYSNAIVPALLASRRNLE